MSQFVYPRSAQLIEIAQTKLPRLIKDRPIFDLMPMVDQDESLLIWEQQDNFIGLQQVRGLGGDPARVKAIGGKRYQMEPGVYGEFADIDEVQLTNRRRYGTFGTPADISDLVMMKQDQLLQRRLDRIELIGWTLLASGTFSVFGPDNALLHTDSFTTQTFTSAVNWSTPATATPLNDFRQIQLLSRGYSVNFGAGAKAYTNRSTFNQLINNTNNADLYGRRTQGLGIFNNLPQLNSLLSGDDLPTIVIYDETYYDDSNAVQLYIPTGTVIVVGNRPAGQRVAEYRMTRNANNPNMAPGAYMKVVDNGERDVPRRIDVHDGHNGGPVIFYPSAIVNMTVN